MLKDLSFKTKSFLLISLFLNILFLYKISKDFFKSYERNHSSDKITYLFNRQTIYKVLPIKRDDIVFVGDSHTQKFDLSEFFNSIHTKNRGIDGDVTAGVLNRLSDITIGHPSKIFLQVGINDIFKYKNVIQAVPNYKRIVKRILEDSPESKIYLISIFPSKLADQDTVLKYNQCIKNISRDNGLTYIDVYDKLNESGKLDTKFDCGDGIHLNGNGYILWSNILKKYITD